MRKLAFLFFLLLTNYSFSQTNKFVKYGGDGLNGETGGSSNASFSSPTYYPNVPFSTGFPGITISENSFAHSITKTIYKYSEIGSYGKINHIGWYHSSGDFNLTNNDTLKIYLKITSESIPSSTFNTADYVLVYNDLAKNNTNIKHLTKSEASEFGWKGVNIAPFNYFVLGSTPWNLEVVFYLKRKKTTTFFGSYIWNEKLANTNNSPVKSYMSTTNPTSSTIFSSSLSVTRLLLKMETTTVLPINLSSFTATQENNSVKLDWLTASEKDNDYFTLYRSADGVNWNEIGQVQGNGTSSVENSYQFVDRQPKKGTNYYKLKQTDFNGEFEEFDPISVEFNGETNAINIYPNPTENDIHIRWEKPIDSYSIQLIDLTGKVIQEYNQSSNEVFNETTFETNFIQNGTYLIRIESNGEIKTEKITIIK